MKRKWVIPIILIAWTPLFYAAWDNTLPADSIAWNVAAGDIRNNNDALEVELGIGLSMEGSASGWYQSSAPTTKADLVTALSASDNGKLWTDSDDGVLSYYVHSSWVGVTTGAITVPRPATLEQTWQFNMADPATLQGLDTQWGLDPNTAAALTISKVEIVLDDDPTTEFDLDLYFANSFIGFAGETLIAAINTTAGVANITTFSDATVPAGKAVYIKWGSAPDAATTQGIIKIIWSYD